MLPKPDTDMLIDYMNFEQGMGCFHGQEGITCACLEDDYMEWFPDFSLHIGNKPYFILKE